MSEIPAEMSELPSEIDITRPHPARMYDYFLGGKNHFAADRETAETVLAAAPTTVVGARENRAFLGRAVRYLVAEAGVRQFLDIGTGLPTTNNVHDVAQAAEPTVRVVYTDNDPLVLAHARALLTSSRAGRTAYIQADLRDPAAILATLLDALPSGSYLTASHVTGEHLPTGAAATTRTYRSSGVPLQVRDSDEFARLAFDGLDLVPPGVVLVSEWRPDTTGPRPAPSEVNVYGGVARKPLCTAAGHCGLHGTSSRQRIAPAARILTVFYGCERRCPA